MKIMNFILTSISLFMNYYIYFCIHVYISLVYAHDTVWGGGQRTTCGSSLFHLFTMWVLVEIFNPNPGFLPGCDHLVSGKKTLTTSIFTMSLKQHKSWAGIYFLYY